MTSISRSSMITTAAALPALAVPALAVPGAIATATPDDDTIARIAEHRRVVLLIDEILDREGDLEEELPDDRKKAGQIVDRGTDVGRDDDPRWTAIQAEH
jgi:hypothetical protein